MDREQVIVCIIQRKIRLNNAKQRHCLGCKQIANEKVFFDKLKEWEILIDVNKNTLENKQ